jgi:hypothetical protein
MINKIKKAEPVDYDAHFRYICPSNDCRYDHWVSLKEAKTKNFKVVCDCGTVFSPRRIKELNILYKEKKIKKPQVVESKKTINVDPIVQKPKISVELLVKCCKLLVGYGFTKQESENLLQKAFEEQQTNNPVELVKIALKKVGEL